MCSGCYVALGSQHPLGAMSTSKLLSSVTRPQHGMDGVRNEETRAKLYSKGSHIPLVLCFTAHFAALTFSFPISKVEKSVTFISNDAFIRKRENINLYYYVLLLVTIVNCRKDKNACFHFVNIYLYWCLRFSE